MGPTGPVPAQTVYEAMMAAAKSQIESQAANPHPKIPVCHTKEEFDKIPPGGIFIDSTDNQVYKKNEANPSPTPSKYTES